MKKILLVLVILLELFFVRNIRAEDVLIVTQKWTVQNLDVSTYSDGTPIRHAASAEDWIDAGNKKEGCWCYYNNDPALGAIYGKLYNWYAVNDARGLAPKGYHVPSDIEWSTFENNIRSKSQYWCNNNNWAIAKSFASKSYWHTYKGECAIGNKLSANNSSGFSALPGGYRDIYGKFSMLKRISHWWTTSEGIDTSAWTRDLHYGTYLLGRNYELKVFGFSVRCIRD